MSNIPAGISRRKGAETERLAALDRYQILDTPPEAPFNDIVAIAAEICGVPMALISLVDSKRQWFKAKVGIDVSETPREIAFCAHAIQQNDVLLVEDASKDSRFADNPLVTGDLHLRFYAGAPLQTPDGMMLGTLCVLDSKPRLLTDSQEHALEALGRQVMTQLELRQALTVKRSVEEREATTLRYIDRLRDISDPREIIAITTQLLGETLKVAVSGYGTMDACGSRVDVLDVWTGPENRLGTHALHEVSAHAPLFERGEAVLIGDIEKSPLTADHADVFRAHGVRSLMSLPVIENGRFVAIFVLLDSKARKWSDDEFRFLRDIAARGRSAIERRRAEAHVRLLADSLHEQVEDRTRERDRLWQLSRDPFLIADSSGVWQRVNPAWTALLGWSDKELLGRTSEWMEHPDDQEKTRAEVRAIVAGHATERFENRFRARDGAYHWFEWTATQSEGLLYCVARDITGEKANDAALKNAEDQLRQSQKMEAVGQLTGGLAHDFNNLLTGISGSLDLLGLRVAQGRLGELDRYVHSAKGAAKRAAALTHRLLAFSRRQTLDPKPTNINRLVSGLSDMIRRTIGPGIELEDIAAGGLWNTLIDPGQMENALLNLCINARDAMPDGGKLTIETGNKWFDERSAQERELSPGQYVFLCVRDTGTGMSPEVIARAFDPFFTTKPIGLGTGLGLSMVYGFARQSGGQVRIDSEIDKGTLICLYLPRCASEAVPLEAPLALANTSPAPRQNTVLVVDDEPTVRMFVAEILLEMGCHALEAADGLTGLKILNSPVEVDLLITDVGLPGGMNGRQLADAARVGRPDLTVLFITGYAENAAISHGHLDAGMHVLTKPFGIEDLTRRIKAIIDP